MEAKAIAKYVRMSPSKIKPVVDLVRGKDLNEALTILKFTPGKGAEIVEKVVQSAAANADVKEMNADNLYVSEVYAHQGPTMKRWKGLSLISASESRIKPMFFSHICCPTNSSIVSLGSSPNSSRILLRNASISSTGVEKSLPFSTTVTAPL